jgi:hypothetical protein
MHFLPIVLLLLAPLIFIVLNTVIRKIAEPHKTWLIHLSNAVLVVPMMLRLGPFKKPLDINLACKEASKKMKLTDFGPPGELQFVENYATLLNSAILKTQTYNPLGFFLAKKELVDTMKARLKRREFLLKHPEVLDIGVSRPIFVIGLPRTGTTFLHRLLSLNPAYRAPLTWELLSPTPLSDTDLEKDRAKRRRKMKENIDVMKSVGGGVLANIHEVGADLPEECLASLTHDLPCSMSLMFAAFVNHEQFFDMNTDVAYANYRNVIQMLSWQTNEVDEEQARHWVFKSPIHVMFVESLVKAFPDAIIIYTHRHPTKSVPSLCSLTQAVHSVFFERSCYKTEVVSQGCLNFAKNGTNMALEALESTGVEHQHVMYDRLVENPKETVRSLYEQFNLDFSQEFEDALDAYLDENAKQRQKLKQGKSVLHNYTAEEFGLTNAQIEEEMSDYIERFFGDDN